MALVSYGSSGESDISDHEEDEVPLTSKIPAKQVPISDDEDVESKNDNSKPDAKPDSIAGIGSILDEDEYDIIGTSSSTASTLFSALKAPESANNSASSSLVDQNEDLSTIPKAKVYSDQPAEEQKPEKKPSIWSSRAKKVRKVGPVKIMAPSLISEEDEDEDNGPRLPAKRPVPTQNGPMTHALFSFLPKPKNNGPKAPPPSTKTTTTSMMPRTVANKKAAVKKPSKPRAESDSEGEDDAPFFSFDSNVQNPTPGPSTSVLPSGINAKPDATAPEGASSVFGPSKAPNAAMAAPTYDDPSDLMANRDEMERLHGRGKKRNHMQQEMDNAVEINASDLTADPREWMKGLTDDSDKPGPRNTIGGLTKKRHQITYLAALAKEKEQELKKMWSENAHSRRASANKYGF